MPGFFMSNLDTMMIPSPQDPKAYIFALPMPPTTPIPWFDSGDDTGKFVKAMVMKQEEVMGKNVLGATDYYTPEQVVETLKSMKKETGAQFIQLDKDTYKGYLAKAGMPEFAQEELYQNMSFMNDYGYYGKKSLDWSLGVSPPSDDTGLYVILIVYQLLDEKPTTLAEFFAKAPKWKDLK